MENLSLNISKMNSLKEKIIKYSAGIVSNTNNIMQHQNVKFLSDQELSEFKSFFFLIKNNSAHFEITNISSRRIKILVFLPKEEHFHYSSCESTVVLVKQVVRLRNIFS
jgi:hypothetical protein